MACLFGHKWDGCKCSKCGKTRDEQHDWDLCKGVCKRCGAKQAEYHDWDGCKCKRCGKTRDEQHDWDGCKCKRCGKEQPVTNTATASKNDNAINAKDSKNQDAGITPIEKFKSMEPTEKEAYLKDVDRFELIEIFKQGRDEQFDTSDIPMLCHALRWRMLSAHEYRHSEFVEKAMLVLSCGNENHVKNYRAGMSSGFIHPDVAARAFDQLINDYKVLITKFS